MSVSRHDLICDVGYVVKIKRPTEELGVYILY